jgi:hypothetical protein
MTWDLRKSLVSTFLNNCKFTNTHLGESTITVNGEQHTFLMDDDNHSDISNIKKMLKQIRRKIESMLFFLLLLLNLHFNQNLDTRETSVMFNVTKKKVKLTKKIHCGYIVKGKKYIMQIGSHSSQAGYRLWAYNDPLKLNCISNRTLGMP